MTPDPRLPQDRLPPPAPRLFLATSCFQGLPLDEAVTELCGLLDAAGLGRGEAGIQLCPGNPPTGFAGALEGRPFRKHHTFDPMKRVGLGWHVSGAGVLDFGPLADGDFSLRTIHPPFRREGSIHEAISCIGASDNGRVGLELPMYLDYCGASFVECLKVFESQVPIAVDVSHLNIAVQEWKSSEVTEFLDRAEGAAVSGRLLEIHVSANNGRSDQHRPITNDDFGIAWAKRVSREYGIPLVLECYMHRLTHQERIQQVRSVLVP